MAPKSITTGVAGADDPARRARGAAWPSSARGHDRLEGQAVGAAAAHGRIEARASSASVRMRSVAEDSRGSTSPSAPSAMRLLGASWRSRRRLSPHAAPRPRRRCGGPRPPRPSARSNAWPMPSSRLRPRDPRWRPGPARRRSARRPRWAPAPPISMSTTSPTPAAAPARRIGSGSGRRWSTGRDQR